MRWPLQPLQPLQQTQLQPLFGPSVDSLCHPWFTTTNLSYRFPILKLPPPPCAVLLVWESYVRFWNWYSTIVWYMLQPTTDKLSFGITNHSVATVEHPASLAADPWFEISMSTCSHVSAHRNVGWSSRSCSKKLALAHPTYFCLHNCLQLVCWMVSLRIESIGSFCSFLNILQQSAMAKEKQGATLATILRMRTLAKDWDDTPITPI